MLSSLRKALPMAGPSAASSALFSACRALSSFRILRLDNLSSNKGAFKKVSPPLRYSLTHCPTLIFYSLYSAISFHSTTTVTATVTDCYFTTAALSLNYCTIALSHTHCHCCYHCYCQRCCHYTRHFPLFLPRSYILSHSNIIFMSFIAQACGKRYWVWARKELY